jgi:hypothetical protein
MSNMSYCKFQNTDRDFDDCVNDVENRIDSPDEDLEGDPIEPLSEHETRSAVSLILKAQDLVLMVSEACNIEGLDELTDTDVKRFVAHLNLDAIKNEKKRDDRQRREKDAERDDVPLGQPSPPLGS